MRFQNFWEDFVDFLDSVVSQAKRILFDSNKIVCPELSRSGQTSAFIKKRNPTVKQSGFKKNKLWEIKCGNRKEQKECQDFLPLWTL